MPEAPEEGKLVGEVTHYFGHPEVAIIKLEDSLEVGDTIRIVGGTDTDFEQEVTSMEVDNEKIEEASAGDEVGVKVDEKVRETYEVYKV